MSMNFQIGQRVECVNDDWHPKKDFRGCPRPPIRGGIFVICGFDPCPITSDLFLQLEEMPEQWIFLADHFRPLTEKKTNTEIGVFESPPLVPAPRQLENV